MAANIFPVLSAESALRQVLHATECLNTPDSFYVLEPGCIVSPNSLELDFHGKGYQLYNAPSGKFPTIEQNTKFEITKSILMHVSNAVVFPNTGQVIKDGIALREKYAPSGYFERTMEDLKEIFGYDPIQNSINFSNQFSFAKKYENYNMSSVKFVDESYYLLSNEINDQRFAHWMLLRLPEARLFSSILKRRIGFTSSYDLLPWQIDSLNTFFRNKISKLFYFREPIKFKSLFFVGYSNKNYLKVDYEHYDWLKSFTQHESKEVLPARIYLSRSDVNRRHYTNESDVVTALDKYGIKKIEMSKHTMAKQFQIASNAEVVIMPAGSTSVFFPFFKKDCCIIQIDWNNTEYFDKHFELYTILHKLKNAHLLKNAINTTNELDDDVLAELKIEVLTDLLDRIL